MAAFMKSRISVLGPSLGSPCFQKTGPESGDQSTVGQAAPNTKARHNPVSLMQDLKNTTGSGISRPRKLWVLLKLGSVLDLENLQSPKSGLSAVNQNFRISGVLLAWWQGRYVSENNTILVNFVGCWLEQQNSRQKSY